MCPEYSEHKMSAKRYRQVHSA